MRWVLTTVQTGLPNVYGCKTPELAPASDTTAPEKTSGPCGDGTGAVVPKYIE